MIKKFLGCVREYKKPTIFTFFLILGEAAIEALIPFITAELVNKVESGTTVGAILRVGAILAGMAVVSLCFGGFAGYTSAKASAGFAKNLRSDLFSKIQSYAFSNIDKFSSSSLVTRMTTDVTNVQMSYMMLIRIAVRAPLMLTFSIIMAYIMGGSLATLFVIVVPVLVGGLIIIAKMAMGSFRRVFKKYDKLNESIEENVRAMRTVKGYSREEHEKGKFKASAEDISKDFTKAERIVAFTAPLMQLCVYTNMIFVLLVGSRLIINSGGTAINVGEISAMLVYGFQVLMQLMMLSMVYVMLTMSAESIKRIVEVLDEYPAISNPENPVTQVSDGSIEFKNASFKYSLQAKKFALENINLKINSGITVGIIGGIGASKSSLVGLIPRLYDVTEGEVLVGGVDVQKYDLSVLRDSVAMVLQKNTLFSGTIKENLRWGNPNATNEDMKEACRLAAADEFIKSLPDGYDTYIEQDGTNVSGGQKQRLCIARALLKKPKILILDDSTSAVDTKTDALIRDGLRRFIPQTTKIIIAQRITSVMDADMILVMDSGSIVDAGTHGELLERCNIYSEVYYQQTKRGEDNE